LNAITKQSEVVLSVVWFSLDVSGLDAQMKALVVIPTHNHGATLAVTVQWLRLQRHDNFEAVVIGDGVPTEIEAVLRHIAAIDARIRVEFHPKHPRRGETYRDAVIRSSDADVICYLTDRDIWFPDHLSQMVAMLSEADYAHSLGVHVSQPGYRHMLMTTNDNRMPFSSFGHRRDAYIKLVEGWTTTPKHEWTDLYMIRKFVSRSDLHGISGLTPTAATFPSPPRIDWSMERRAQELQQWSERLQHAETLSAFRLEMLQAALIAQRNETGQLAELIGKLAAQPARAATTHVGSFANLNTYRNR
jgi:GalNAc5-diNAcBac-PP-undecaprenol beta-1,3-glucosyltransferase